MRMVILRGWASASTPISYTPLSTIGRTGNGLVPAELLAPINDQHRVVRNRLVQFPAAGEAALLERVETPADNPLPEGFLIGDLWSLFCCSFQAPVFEHTAA